MGRNSEVKNRTRPVIPKHMVEMVDARTGDHHLLTLDAASAGQQAPNRHLAVCGAEIVPAALVDPGRGYCWPCRSKAPTLAPHAGSPRGEGTTSGQADQRRRE